MISAGQWWPMPLFPALRDTCESKEEGVTISAKEEDQQDMERGVD